MMSAGRRGQAKKIHDMEVMRINCHKLALLHLRSDEILPLKIVYTKAKGRGIQVKLGSNRIV